MIRRIRVWLGLKLVGYGFLVAPDDIWDIFVEEAKNAR